MRVEGCRGGRPPIGRGADGRGRGDRHGRDAPHGPWALRAQDAHGLRPDAPAHDDQHDPAVRRRHGPDVRGASREKEAEITVVAAVTDAPHFSAGRARRRGRKGQLFYGTCEVHPAPDPTRRVTERTSALSDGRAGEARSGACPPSLRRFDDPSPGLDRGPLPRGGFGQPGPWPRVRRVNAPSPSRLVAPASPATGARAPWAARRPARNGPRLEPNPGPPSPARPRPGPPARRDDPRGSAGPAAGEEARDKA